MTKKKLLVLAAVVLALVLLVVYMAPFRIQVSGDVYSLTENEVAGQWELDLIHVRIPLLGHKIFGKPQFPEGCSPIKHQGGGYWHCYTPAGVSDLHMLTAPFHSERDNSIHFLSGIYYPALRVMELSCDGTLYLFPASTEAEAQAVLGAIDDPLAED